MNIHCLDISQGLEHPQNISRDDGNAFTALNCLFQGETEKPKQNLRVGHWPYQVP